MVRNASAIVVSQKLASPNIFLQRDVLPLSFVHQLNGLFTFGCFAEVEIQAHLLIEQFPNSGAAWKALAASLLAQDKDALPALRRTVELLPSDRYACANLCKILYQGRQIDELIVTSRSVLTANSGLTEAHVILGNALRESGDSAGAAASYRRALITAPNLAEVHSNLGITLFECGDFDEAVACHRRAIAINPNLAEVHANLGNALRESGKTDAAVASYREALRINPSLPHVHADLGGLLHARGELEEALVCYRNALEIDPGLSKVHAALLFCLCHSGTSNAGAIFFEHRQFAHRFETPLKSNWPHHGNSREVDRPLRVGFVSGDFRNHAVSHFFEPVLAQLASCSQMVLHAYYNHAVEDDFTQRIRCHFKHWHVVALFSDAALAEKITADGIDILIDLAGHTGHNRLLTFARKPAPIQASWIGYPNTTGLQAMDYLLCDRFNAPYDLYEHYYVEKFARLPTSATFVPQDITPDVNILPVLKKKYITFASFNRPEKLGRQVIEVWCEVLHAVPGSVLMVGNVPDASMVEVLTARFAEHGVGAQRLLFQPRLSLDDYLKLHHEIDIVLDTWPYTGGTTTNFALWMGVPAVTLTGSSRAHCQSAAVLGRLGLEDWIAHDAEEFIRIAVQWANAPAELARLRAGMRERLQTVPLCQPATVANGLVRAFRMMWWTWCTGLPTEHFEIAIESSDVVPEVE